MDKKLYCPRCGNTNIKEYDSSFDCPECKLEFEIDDFNSIKDKSSILSIEEKSSFTGTFKSNKEKTNK